MKTALSLFLASIVLVLTSCGENPADPEQWEDGAWLYLAGSYPDTSLAWSPTGYVLLFSTSDGTSACIYGYDGVTDPINMTATTLEESVGPTGCWSNDRGMVAFNAISGNIWSQVRVMPGNLGPAVILLNDGLKHLHPTWSPDSDTLLFSTLSDGYWSLWKAPYDEDSLVCTEFYSPLGDCFRPSYSPDGEWILFQVDDGSQSDIWLIRPDGSDAHAVIDGTSNDIHPCWGPEDDWFAFSSDMSGQQDIWISNIDGSSLVQVTDDPGTDIYPAWHPLYGWFAFSSDRVDGGDYDIFSIEAPDY